MPFSGKDAEEYLEVVFNALSPQEHNFGSIPLVAAMALLAQALFAQLNALEEQGVRPDGNIFPNGAYYHYYVKPHGFPDLYSLRKLAQDAILTKQNIERMLASNLLPLIQSVPNNVYSGNITIPHRAMIERYAPFLSKIEYLPPRFVQQVAQHTTKDVKPSEQPLIEQEYTIATALPTDQYPSWLGFPDEFWRAHTQQIAAWQLRLYPHPAIWEKKPDGQHILPASAFTLAFHQEGTENKSFYPKGILAFNQQNPLRRTETLCFPTYKMDEVHPDKNPSALKNFLANAESLSVFDERLLELYIQWGLNYLRTDKDIQDVGLSLRKIIFSTDRIKKSMRLLQTGYRPLEQNRSILDEIAEAAQCITELPEELQGEVRVYFQTHLSDLQNTRPSTSS